MKIQWDGAEFEGMSGKEIKEAMRVRREAVEAEERRLARIAADKRAAEIEGNLLGWKGTRFGDYTWPQEIAGRTVVIEIDACHDLLYQDECLMVVGDYEIVIKLDSECSDATEKIQWIERMLAA